MYILFVFAQWVVSSLLKHRDRAEYMKYLLLDALS